MKFLLAPLLLSVLTVPILGQHRARMAPHMTGAGPAAIVTITIEPTKDNSIYEETDPGSQLSNGAGQYLFVGQTNDDLRRRAILAFDVARFVPAGSVVTAASLQMRMSRTKVGPQDVSLHLATGDWGEGTSIAPGQEGAGAPATTGDATWLYAFHDTASWTTNGGDFAGASATTSVDGNGSYSWSSAQMISDVQSWVDAPGLDFGWFVIGQEPGGGGQTAKRFASRENTSAGNRPLLTITFTTTETVGACCLPDGTCVDTTSGLCGSALGAYQGDGTNCATTTCSVPTGACCASDGTCTSETQADCDSAGGTWQGPSVSCSPNPCPVTLTPFLDPLPIPVVATPVSGTSGGVADYVLAMTEFEQQLHSELPGPTRLWGYDGIYPGPTIEAAVGQRVTVNWVNDLRDYSTGDLRTVHYLPVDLCPHGPNHEGDNPRAVVHLHGAHVEAEFDGYPEDTILPGESDLYVYENHQLPATLWYHDHALGITRLNVYLGLGAFYLIRDAFEQALTLPSGAYEIPMLVQDRSFEPDGSLRYPAAWQEHFFGDKILVNGKVWPYLEVDQGKYRFRVLNGSNSRTLTLALSNGATFHMIGTDGGLLPAPVPLTEITLTPAERADLVVDFAPYTAGTEIDLVNSAPAPYPGTPGVGVVPDVMRFVVQGSAGYTASLPSTLRPLEVLQESDATEHRTFELRRSSDPCTGQTWLINGLGWDDITEEPILGETEVWAFVNRSGIAHPMHMHLVMFQILDRQDFEIIEGEVVPTGPRVPPPAHEAGWKDTVQTEPNTITRVIARFEDYTGLFAYHCHILEHEDHEMMRQFRVVPPPPRKFRLTTEAPTPRPKRDL